jgi:hypothetical protein
MTFEGFTESGAEEWVCFTCGRRMFLRWPPRYEKFVLEHGDVNAIHVGGKGGLRVGRVEVAPTSSTDVPSSERQWLRDHGIDWDAESA